MESRIKLFVLFLAGIAIFTYIFLNYMPQQADIIYTNGRLYTMDESNSLAQAMAISGDRILGIGSEQYIGRMFRTKNIVDLKGKTVFPGFIDAHCHLLGMGLAKLTVDLVGLRSEQEAVDRVKQKAEKLHSGQWIRGRGWDQNEWTSKKFPTHNSLDKITPTNPVYLIRIDGHACWVNEKAMSIAGITKSSVDPPGGRIVRDAKGNPTGVFIDVAMDLVYKYVPEPAEDELREAIKHACEECVSYGITSVQEMGIDLKQYQLYQKLIHEGIFPIRMYACIDGPGDAWEYFKKVGPLVGWGDNKLTVRGFKIYADGALGSRGAAMIEPYSDDSTNRGLTILSDEELDSLVDDAVHHNFQVCTHAIGDRANHVVLDAYQKVLRKFPSSDLRLRVEHAQVIAPEDIPRFKLLGIIPSMQPTHCTSDMYWAEARLGPVRVRGAYAWRTLLNTGVIIPGGSDAPVQNPNPLLGIYAACTRQDLNGLPRNADDVQNYFQLSSQGLHNSSDFDGGWYVSEKMTRAEAAKCFTIWAAQGAFEENLKGSLRQGMLADFVILSSDVMTVPAQQILNTRVEMTVLGGKVVYEAQKN